jgi:hypothetical protein
MKFTWTLFKWTVNANQNTHWCTKFTWTLFKWTVNANQNTHWTPTKKANSFLRYRKMSLVRGTVLGTVNRLRGGRSGVRIQEGKIYYFLQNVQITSGVHPASNWIDQDVNLTSDLRLAPRLRINGAVTLLPYTPSCSRQGQLYLSLIHTTAINARFG